MTPTSRVLDPVPCSDLAQYERNGGGDGLRIARDLEPSTVIDLVARSGLRGRGGAGFPTGRKWHTVASYASPSSAIPMVVNAAEGEPGTFKDRAIIRANPYRLVEGALIGAHAVGANQIIIGTKASFQQENQRLRQAIDEIDSARWLAGVRVDLVEGPGEYLFGEETALLEVIEGWPPFPRVAPPYRRGIDPAGLSTSHSAAGVHLAAESGTDRPPALVDNAETLANVPKIVAQGSDWFRSVGTEASPGTIVCTVTGSTRRHGVGEFVIGTPLREVIETLGGGLRPNRRVRAVLSGVSSPPLGADALDTPLTYEAMAEAGSGLGSASLIVLDDTVSLRRTAHAVARFLAVESCGQCEPCKRDGLAITAALAEDEPDLSAIERRVSTVARGARCALAGQTERVVGGLLSLARVDDDNTSPESVIDIVPLVDIVASTAVLDLSFHHKRPDWTYSTEGRDSGKWPAQRLADQHVSISPPRTPEPASRPVQDIDDVIGYTFRPLIASHARLGDAIEALRGAAYDERSPAAKALRTELIRHIDITERIIYPLVSRLEPAMGDDLSWYPDLHEHHAARLLDRLRAEPLASSTRLIDDIAADIHRSILELELRVFPVLDRYLDDTARELLVTAFVDAGLT